MQHDNNLKTLKNKEIVIGIDIAKHLHYASIIEKANGIVLKKGIKIFNNRNSFEMFTKLIKKWDVNKIIIGMEPTGHYWKVLNNWLVSHGYKTVLVNPYHVKLTKEVHNNLNNKNDEKDSQLIAHLVRNSRFLNVMTIEKNYDELRQLSLLRDTLVKDCARVKTRLRTLLDEFVPEYHHCFRDPSRITSLSLLEKYSLKSLTGKENKTRKINLITKVSRGAISKEKAKIIIQMLSNGVGIATGINGAEYSLKLIIEQIKYNKEKIKEIEQNMKIYLEQLPEYKYMLSMPGMGVVTLSGLLGRTGCLEKFSHPTQMQKFAGMLPVQHQSGTFKGQTKLSKRGSNKVRNILYRIAVSFISNNDEMKELYQYKLNKFKKKKMVALTSIASKGLRILFKLGRDKVFYNKKLIRKSLISS